MQKYFVNYAQFEKSDEIIFLNLQLYGHRKTVIFEECLLPQVSSTTFKNIILIYLKIYFWLQSNSCTTKVKKKLLWTCVFLYIFKSLKKYKILHSLKICNSQKHFVNTWNLQGSVNCFYTFAESGTYTHLPIYMYRFEYITNLSTIFFNFVTMHFLNN